MRGRITYRLTIDERISRLFLGGAAPDTGHAERSVDVSKITPLERA
jgi:hypothetical protein